MSVRPNPQSASEQISHLTSEILFSLARNESGLPEYRKAAVKLLMDKRHPKVNHPELAKIVSDIEKEREAEGEVEAIVEAAIEQPIPAGPFQASITTQTMQTEEVVDNAPVITNPLALNDDALAEAD